MTPFALLLRLAGLSYREAGEFFAVRPDTVQSWAIGRRVCPTRPLDKLRGLITAQERAAAEVVKALRDGASNEIELDYPADDSDARALGWPCVGAWGAMAARVISAANVPARIVHRGATIKTTSARTGNRPD